MAPLVKPIFSQNYWAVQKRVQRLPRVLIGKLKAAAKTDAQNVITVFQQGIETRSLHLQALRPRTIEEKERKGFLLPLHPLYGVGLEDERSYINMLEVVNKGDRMWVVQPKKGYHHKDPDHPEKRELLLKDLFDVHEYGTVITNGFGKGIFIRIPPRPALRYAYRKYMAAKAKEDPSVKVRAAIAQHVQDGDRQALARISAKLAKGLR